MIRLAELPAVAIFVQVPWLKDCRVIYPLIRIGSAPWLPRSRSASIR